jgi:hypothetical protein
MIDISIDERQTNAALRNAATGDNELYDAMESSLALLHSEMARYPQQRTPKDRRRPYRRTGLLGRTWTSKITRKRSEVTGELGNNARDRRGRSYGPYVQADPSGPKPHQAWMHVSVWATDQDVADRMRPQIIARFNRALERMVGG